MVKPVLKRGLLFVVALIFVLIGAKYTTASTLAPLPGQVMPAVTPEPLTDALVARLHFKDPEEISQLASRMDIWEVHRGVGYILAAMGRDQFNQLRQDGYTLLIDYAKTARFNDQPSALPDQISGIPGYPCYRTVEETYADLEALSKANPNLARWIDIGDSWEKLTPADETGYDINALVLTNQAKKFPFPKPKFFLMAAIHAREYTTAELAARFAEHLVAGYGVNADITWLLDYFEVHIVPITNPDGRKLAEAGYYQRKNTNDTNGGSCAVPPEAWDQYGTDLNRNHTHNWGGASVEACSEIYQGPSAASEPETQAVEAYLEAIYPDQRAPGDDDPAPSNSTGVLISLHSYSQLVLWPWGYTYKAAPNDAALKAFAHKLAYFNNYLPQQSSALYPTTGDTTDFAYGELGIAAFTFEIGTEFFQDCESFEDYIYHDNLMALLYAFKSARQPYLNTSGPDSVNVAVSPTSIQRGGSLMITAIADDARSYAGVALDSIIAARYSIDAPAWIDHSQVYALAPADGNFDGPVETVKGTLDTSTLSLGQHILFVESQDATGHWGVPTAIFFRLDEPKPHLFLPLVGR